MQKTSVDSKSSAFRRPLFICLSACLPLCSILNSSRARPLHLIVETMKYSSFGKVLCCCLSEKNWSPGFVFFMLVVRWLSIDNTYFPLRILYVILYILHVSLWAVLEAQCSWTDNFRTETESSCMILHLHKSCEGLPVPLSKQQICFGKGKGTLFCLV